MKNQGLFTRLQMNYQKHRMLSVGVVLFLSVQLYYTLLSREQFPFVHSGMYSQRFFHEDTQWVYDLRMGGKVFRLHDFPPGKREVVVKVLETCNGGHVSEEQKRFSARWLLGYLGDMRLLKEPWLEADAVQVVWDGSRLRELSRKNILDYRYE